MGSGSHDWIGAGQRICGCAIHFYGPPLAQEEIDGDFGEILALEESPSGGDTSGLATSSEIAALASHGDAHWATADISGLPTFQPGTDTINVGLSGLADKASMDSVAAVAAYWVV